VAEERVAAGLFTFSRAKTWRAGIFSLDDSAAVID
jgi:hypothetical protein